MKYKILITLLLAISFTTFSQGKRDRIKAVKVAFITNELNLTTSEAEKFWPLFNDFEEKQRDIRRDKLKNYINRSEQNDLSEKEATALLNQMESAEEELHNLRKKFILNLKNVLPATKILKLKKAEEKFNRKLLEQYKENRPRR